MGILQAAVGLLNKIIVMAATAIGLIVAPAPGVPQQTPAIVIQNGQSNGSQKVWQVNFSGSTVQSGGLLLRGDLVSRRLLNCNTVDTTSSGTFVCGTDTGGSGGGSVDTGAILAVGNSRWVNTSGDTMTGALSITGAGLNVSGLATTNRNISLQSGGLSRWTVRVDNAQNYKLVRHDGAGTALDSPFEINPTTGFVQIGDVAKAPSVQLEVNGAMSGSTLTTTALKNCTNVSTSAGGVYACNNNVYLATSTGALQEYLDTLFLKNSEADTESELETLLTDVTNVFTNNDGALDDDDLSDNTTSQLAEGSNLYYTTTRGDGRYVNTSGDTMTGALLVKAAISGATLRIDGLKGCDTIDTSVAGELSCGTDNTGTDSADDLSDNTTTQLAEGTNLYYTTTRADGRYVNTSGDTMTGTLTLRGTMTGWHLFAGTLSGAGLVDCDTAGTSKLLWDVSSRTFSCGSDTDTNTTYTAAQGLTLLGTSFRLNDTISGSLVRFRTLSGSDIFAKTSLRSSGSLTWEGAASGSTLYLGGTLDGAGLTDCDTAGTSKILWDATTKKFSCGTDTDTNTTYTAGQGLTLNGTVFTLNPSNSGSLARYTTLSGATVFASKILRSSGALTWETAASGSTLYLGGTLEGAGLVDCDADNQTLAWDATTKKFLCGDDDTSASGFDFATADARYVKKQGDTMSGALVILMTGGNNNTVSFETPHTASGLIIHAQDLLRSSGALAIEGAAAIGGTVTAGDFSCANCLDFTEISDALTLDATTTLSQGNFSYAFNLNGTGDFFIQDASSTFISFTDLGIMTFNADGGDRDLTIRGDTDVNLFYADASADRVGIGTASPDAKLDVQGTASASTLTVTGLKNCTALETGPSGSVTCGTDDLGSGSFDQSSTDLRYVRRSGSTMTGGLLILSGGTGTQSIDAGLLLEIAGTASGRVLSAADLLTSSGSLAVERTASFGSGVYLSDGVATAPGLSFVADKNTGIFRRGSKQIGFSTNGVERMYLDNVGRLGIGASPTAQLSVGNSAGVASISGVNLTMMRGTSYLMGNVGIGAGATSPSYNLHVKTGVGEGDTQFAVEDPDSSGSNGVYARLVSNGSSPNAGFLFNSGGTQHWSVQYNNSNSVQNLQISRDSGAGHLLLLNSNVGIGTSTPGDALEVIGTMSGRALGINGHVVDVEYSRKAVNEQTVTNSSTLVQHYNLSFSGAALSTYKVEVVSTFAATAAGDFKFGLNAPTGSEVLMRADATTGTTASQCGINSTTAVCAVTAAAALKGTAILRGLVQTGPTAGRISFQFAQNTADAGGPAVIFSGSVLHFMKTR